MFKKILLPILLVIPGFAHALGELTLHDFLSRCGIPEPAIKQVIAKYAPGNGTPSTVSRLLSEFHGYVEQNGSISMIDSAIYSYSNGRGGDLNSARIDYSKMNSFTSYGPIYEKVLTQTFDAYGRVDTVLFISRWDQDPFYNNSRDFYWYNIPGKDSLKFYQQWKNAGWVDWMRVNTRYNQAGNLAGSLTEHWNENTLVWDSLYRSTNTYNSSGKLMDSLEERTDWHPPLGNVWRNYSRTTYTYDASGNPASRTFDQEDTPGYHNMQRAAYYFDANNVFTAQAYEKGYSQPGNTVSFKTDSMTVLPHSVDPNVLVITYYSMDNNGWRPNSRISAKLSTTGNLLAVLYEAWDNNQWINIWREWDSYNSYDQLTRYYIETWHNNSWSILPGDRENRYYYEPYNGLSVHNNALNASSLMLYPVPAGDAITISLAFDAPQSISAKITDAGSRIVRSWNEKVAAGLYTRDLETRDLPGSTYFLSIRSGQGSISKAFTVQH